MVMLGKGADMIGLHDLNIANRLCLLMTGGHRSADMVGRLRQISYKLPTFYCNEKFLKMSLVLASVTCYRIESYTISS